MKYLMPEDTRLESHQLTKTKIHFLKTSVHTSMDVRRSTEGLIVSAHSLSKAIAITGNSL